MIILIKVNNVKNVYKIIHTIFLKCKNENDIENENIKFLFKNNDFEFEIFNKDLFIIKNLMNIFIVLIDFICLY